LLREIDDEIKVKRETTEIKVTYATNNQSKMNQTSAMNFSENSNIYRHP